MQTRIKKDNENILTESHILKSSELLNLCPKGKDLYNATLYQSGNGKVINADVNGSIGMLRKKKVVSESWLKTVGNRGGVYSPVKITLF
jgi:hypothetical protein